MPIPVIGRIEAGNVVLDLRCLEDEAAFLAQLGELRRDATMILATAGHIDHGKTALVQALTGVDADRLPEEKRRGLTIDLGFAYATLPDGTELGFVDVPGHERFLPNMLAGVLSIDRVLLVVAADDGPRPQTIEHLDILELIEVAEVTGVVTKIDRVAPERVATVVGEVEELLAAAGYADSPIFPVSSRTGDGIAALTRHLQERRAAIAERAPRRGDRIGPLPDADRPRLHPSRDRARRDRHGRRRRGRDRRPARRSARGGIARAGARIARAEPADRDRRRRRALRRQHRRAPFPKAPSLAAATGCVAPERHLPARRLDLFLRASRYAEAPLRDGLPVHLHLGTEDVVGRAAVLERPSDRSRRNRLCADRSRAADWRAARRPRCAARPCRPPHLGGGRVVDPLAPRRGRRLPARLALLEAMAPADPATGIRAIARRRRASSICAHFALVRNLAPAELDALTDGAEFLRVGPAASAGRGHSRARLAALADRIVERSPPRTRPSPTRSARPGQPCSRNCAVRRRKRRSTRRWPQLAAAGRAVREGGMWRLARASAAADQCRREAVGARPPAARRWPNCARRGCARSPPRSPLEPEAVARLSEPRRAPGPRRQSCRQSLFSAGNRGAPR